MTSSLEEIGWLHLWGGPLLGLLLLSVGVVLLVSRRHVQNALSRGDLHNFNNYRMSGPLTRRSKGGEIEVYSRPVIRDEVFREQRGD